MTKSPKRTPQRQRRLLLLRHTKSAWPEGVADHRRPLAERGRTDAPALGNYMARQHLLPDMALISDALRAQETWDLVRLRLPGEVTSRLVPELYEATPERMLAILQKTDMEADTVLMVGHNPGMQELALMLVGEGNLQARTAVSEKYPTGALAIIDFPSFDWAHIEPGSGVLAGFVTPRSLK